ncbi:MAG: carboxypeptidase regulatory-like domain-containing protein [Bacteroidales bacterium]|nr:carboxypeptidase regulatory-like domain-containing protein [Bacteroidales bacterium]
MKKLFLFALFALMFAGCTEDEYTLFGKVIGTVTDATTGEPISYVTMTLSPSGKSATTGSDGIFEFNDLEAVQYKMQARHANYKTDTKTVTVLAGEIVRGDMQLTPKE